MNKKNLFISFALIILSILFISSITAFSPKQDKQKIIQLQGAIEPKYENGTYNYIFPLQSSPCDLHWVRMLTYYNCGILPDAITIIPPDITIGFYNKLNLTQETCLADNMNTKNFCIEPQGIRCKIHAEITPQAMENTSLNSIGFKPLYYSDGKNVYVVLFNMPTALQVTQLQNALKNMWVFECK